MNKDTLPHNPHKCFILTKRFKVVKFLNYPRKQNETKKEKQNKTKELEVK